MASVDSSNGAARAETAPAPSALESRREVRKLSLASQLETMTQSGAFLRAITENQPEVAVCRAILQKKPGKRSLDDIHVLKSLLAGSKLLEFFSNLDAYKIDKLYQSIDIVVYDDKGSFVFEQDDPGDSFYMVFRGQVEIRQRDLTVVDNNKKKPVTVHIAFLHPGDSFGERALLYESDRRSASAITACDYTELLLINRIVFTDLLKESQDADASGSTLEVTKRFRSNKDIIRNIFNRASAQRSEKDLKFAVEYLKSVKFFSRFSFEVRKQLCKAMKIISAVTNTVLFEEGQEGLHFYIIFSGSVEVSVYGKNRFDEVTENVVGKLAEGEYFGELALSETGGLRRATVTCSDFCELLVLGRDQYEPLIKKYQNEYHAQYAKMLSKNTYFIGPEWDEYTVQAMCAVMAEKYFPFRSEICKQGSRATEMFVITRGECVVIHEGKHPITGEPQQYELGRFGPNSVLSCAEASSGRFNDIFIRDFSIVAESPVRMLVLSRFDIFHLMSAGARESLQRSSVGYIRESIESRAIKTVTWERYRKSFLNEVLAQRDTDNNIGAGRGPVSRLSKSSSTPVLTTYERTLKPLVQPGELNVEPRNGRAIRKKGGRPRLGLVKDPLKAEDATEQDPESDASDLVPDKRRNTIQVGDDKNHIVSSKPRKTGELATPLEEIDGTADEEMVRNDVSTMMMKPLRVRRQSMARSKTFAVLETVPSTQSQSLLSAAALPKLFHEKPLYSSTASLASANGSPAVAGPGSAPSYSSERRRSARLRSDAGLGLRSAGNTTAIWNPVHGACQPFAVLGFMRERPLVKTILAKHTRTSGSASSSGSIVKAAVPHTATTEPLATGAASEPAVFTAFRVFGKFTDLPAALDLFRHVCSLETATPAGSDRDTSRFAIYKEDEMTMALENYFTQSDTDAANATSTAATATAYQYRPGDLPQANGQRYACVSVSIEMPTRLIENVAVHVYQCFPTPQSAVRFAKQMATAALATMVLYVVPLFEWVPIAEIDRFDAKCADLEQSLESVSFNMMATTESGKSLSTWKARKEAMKKARVHVIKHT